MAHSRLVTQKRGDRLLVCRPLSAALVAILLSGAALLVAAQSAQYVPLTTVQPLLAELQAIAPAALRSLSPDNEGAWSAWIVEHDRDIRARLSQGEEDTVINWLLLGSSFTLLPAAALDATKLTDPDTLRRTAALLRARLDAFMQALGSPQNDERRLVARQILESNGFNLATDAGVALARAHLLDGLQRIILESSERAQDLERARQAGDSTSLARQFRNRGLSLDTSLPPNYALEQSLRAMKTQGLLEAGSVRRVGIIGAGLDFADKNSGFDFYPPQTVQPFAVLDTLRRLQLGPSSGNIQVTVLDISPRILDHITRARAQAANGTRYTLRLPLDSTRAWLPGFRDYWKTFGDRIGVTVTAPTPKNIPPAVEMRTVRLVPATVQRVSATNLNVVAQHVEQTFDLMIATNVLIYYDQFDQALALTNVERMLRPGGIFLVNNALPHLAASSLRQVGSLTTVYTEDGTSDEVTWHQRSARNPN